MNPQLIDALEQFTREGIAAGQRIIDDRDALGRCVHDMRGLFGLGDYLAPEEVAPAAYGKLAEIRHTAAKLEQRAEIAERKVATVRDANVRLAAEVARLDDERQYLAAQVAELEDDRDKWREAAELQSDEVQRLFARVHISFGLREDAHAL